MGGLVATTPQRVLHGLVGPLRQTTGDNLRKDLLLLQAPHRKLARPVMILWAPVRHNIPWETMDTEDVLNQKIPHLCSRGQLRKWHEVGSL